MHGHPWRWLRALPHITLDWSRELPEDLMGYAEFDGDRITLAEGMTQAERRSTCWHEVVHLMRGPVPPHLAEREEQAVNLQVARDLIPFNALVEAMLWSLDEWEIAEELTVDVALVRVRLHALTAAETRDLNAALDAAERTIP